MIILDEHWIYRFIRTDLPFKQHAVQLVHASWKAGAHFGAKYNNPQTGTAICVLIGIDTVPQLLKVAQKMVEIGVDYILQVDTDVDPDPTAICVAPVDAAMRNKYFARYRPYNADLYSGRGISSAVFDDKAGAKADLAQSRASGI